MYRAWIIALSLYVAPVWAGAETEVVVVGVHLDGRTERVLDRLNEKMLSVVERTPGLHAVGPELLSVRLGDRGARIVEQAISGQGRTFLAEGRVLLEQADLEGAIDRLDKATKSLEFAMSAATDSKDLMAALLLRGTVQVSMGRSESARATYKRVVVLDPERALEPVHFSPKVVALFSDVRASVLQVPRATLRVQVSDPSASVFVDGRTQGVGSVVVDGLVAGTHHVLVTSASGFRSYFNTRLGPGDDQMITAPLNRRYIGGAGADSQTRSAQTRDLYTGVGDALTNGLVLMAGQTLDGRVAVQLLEPRTGNVSRTLSDEPGSDPAASLLALVAQIGAFITDTGSLRSDAVARETIAFDIESNPVLARLLLQPQESTRGAVPPPSQTRRQRKKMPWYVWAGIGVAAAGATGVAFALQPKKSGGGTSGAEPSTDERGGGDGPTEGETGTVLVPFPG